VIRVESMGSVWTFDDDLHQYMRLPKREQPREQPEWSDERAGALQDGVWHPYVAWHITKHDRRAGQHLIPAGTLVVYYPHPAETNKALALVAPEAHVMGESRTRTDPPRSGP
jgi:hypothetical protein